MEEEKAAAYYDELTRKGGGAARFKQGLGFSSTAASDALPARGSALPSSSSSFLSSFVKASSPSKAAELQKQAQLESIQNKLKKKPNSSSENQYPRVSGDRDRDRDRDRHSRRRSRSRSRSRDGHGSRHRHRHRSSSRERDRDRDRYGEREREKHRERDRDRERTRRRRSRSRSVSDGERGRESGRRSRSRSLSPRYRRSEKSRRNGGKVGKERNGRVDYAKLIAGYDNMTPAERVKAKMKLQLDETAEKDDRKDMSLGWERFEFNKDAPLDDEEVEVAEDDAELVKHIGQSFRFSTVEAKREEEIKAAHDEAMFGASACLPSVNTDDETDDENKKQSADGAPLTSLLSDRVLALQQQGSWRDRLRKV